MGASDLLSDKLGLNLPPLFRQATPAASPETASGGSLSSDSPEQRGLRALYDVAAAIQAQQDAQSKQLERICEAIDGAITLLTQANRADYRQSATLKASEAITIDRLDYKHLYILVTASTSVTFDIPGVGSISRSLNADWNRIEYPTGTRITVANDTNPPNALLYWTDTLLNV